jgi:hypothetical protein
MKLLINWLKLSSHEFVACNLVLEAIGKRDENMFWCKCVFPGVEEDRGSKFVSSFSNS